ncbi:MAG: choice-of-anchor J domain-containing protein [Bacteroidales bacterium]|nr:choice-of-anchor J domain-containing protein [Bacteroidales bacterium]
MKRLVLTLAISLAFAFGGVAQSLHYDFEDGTLQGWTVLDGDGDGHCWESSIGGMGYNSNGMVMAYSKDYATGEPLTPNEYLVSPRLVLSEDWPVIRFYACALDEIYPAEHFGVSISTTVNNDPLAFTLLSEWTIAAKDARNRQGNWYNYTVDLSAYTGQEVYVAIRHHYCSGQSAICVDDIQIDGTIQQDGLVIEPDTLWVTDVYVYQKYFTITNETDHEVTISSIYTEDTIVSLSHYDPAYGLVNVEEVLPVTLEVGDAFEIKTGIQNIILPLAKRNDYIVSPIHIVSTEGENEVILMIDEAAISFGLIAYLPFYGLDSYEPHQFSLVNAEWSGPITITGIEEIGTDYLEITIEDSLPVTLENYGDYLRGSLKCREPFPFHAFVSTSIIVHTSIGDFGAIGVDIDGTMLFSPIGNEWYYEIENENGSITYQYLYQAGDTIVQDEPTHILVKINTLYDKDLHQDVTHEYVYERDGKVYWWNKTLEEFTVLYDFGAHEGDTWVTKVGTETLTMHVDAEEIVEYEGRFYRMLHVSDTDDIFSGDIVCGIGHLTSFFPERLMDNGDGIRVEGMRCYWVENELVFKYGDEDCDAIYDELHGIEENGPSTGSGTLTVYPNPTNGVLFVETRLIASLPDQTYRITNLMGQTVLSGNINADNQQINVSSLPQGMYFITFASETRKFVVR